MGRARSRDDAATRQDTPGAGRQRSAPSGAASARTEPTQADKANAGAPSRSSTAAAGPAWPDIAPPADRALPPPSLPSLAGALAAPVADEPIPMLTEVVQVPRYDAEDLPDSLADVDWGDLAERVRENVLERLLRRSDTLLDANLGSTLRPALERAMESLSLELHGAMNRMIRDIVGRAVTEELTRLHAEIARHHRNQNPPTPR